jgi:hypothetical protein
MSEALAAPQDQSFARAAFTGDWVATWIRLRAERVLSYASEGALG